MGLLEKARAIKGAGEKKEVSLKPEPIPKGLLEKATASKTGKLKKEIPIIEKPKQRIYSAGKIIETDFDLLYKLILQRTKVKVSDIVKMFNIDKKKAEEWMQILDEHDLAKIHYPAMGDPEIRKISENEKTE